MDGKIDAFSMRNPFIQQAKEKLGANAIEFFEPGLYVQSFNLVAPQEMKNNPKIVESVLKSLIKAEEYTYAAADDAILAVANELGKVREAEIKEDWNKYNFEISLKQYLIILLEDETKFAVHQGLNPEDNFPNFLNFIFTDPLEIIDEERVSIIK
jgi:NitT/TauT family transport system substrate-binding protein